MVLEWLFAGQNAARLAQGLWLTAKISLISVALSCVLGTLFGLLMRVRQPLVRFVWRVGVHLGVCGLGHRRDGRFGARRTGVD